MQEEVHRAADRFQMDVESGKRTVVEVNAHAEDDGSIRVGQPDYSALEADQRARLSEFTSIRSADDVRSARTTVREIAASEGNLMLPLMGAVKARVTLGEISDVLREAWGTYDG